MYRDWLRRRKTETDDELQRLKGEVASGGFVCHARGNASFGLVSGDFGEPAMVANVVCEGT